MFIFHTLCCIGANSPGASSRVSQRRVRSAKNIEIDLEDKFTSLSLNCDDKENSSDAVTKASSVNGSKLASEIKLEAQNSFGTQENKISPNTVKYVDSALKSAKTTLNNGKASQTTTKAAPQNLSAAAQKSTKMTKTSGNLASFYIMVDSSAKEWTVKHVIKFLNQIQLSQYENKFYENKIRGKDLITLSEKELTEDLGMTQADSKKLLTFIETLRQESAKSQKSQKSSFLKTQKTQKIQSLCSLSSTKYSSFQKTLSLISDPIMEESDEGNLIDEEPLNTKNSESEIARTASFDLDELYASNLVSVNGQLAASN